MFGCCGLILFLTQPSVSFGLLLFGLTLGHRSNSADESFLSNSLVISAVEFPLKASKVLTGNLKAAIAEGPAGDVVHGHVSHAVLINALEDTLSIDLKFVAAEGKLFFAMSHSLKELIKLTHPGLGVKVLLFK
jgi:hypothetical protein